MNDAVTEKSILKIYTDKENINLMLKYSLENDKYIYHDNKEYYSIIKSDSNNMEENLLKINLKKHENNLPAHFVTLFSMLSSVLASSCCLIQLILNIFSLGCAGFAVFDKYEIHFFSFMIIFLCILVFLRGIKNSYKLIFLCILIASSKRIVNLYLKDENIQSNALIIIKGVKCNGCALKLCSELNSLAKRCSIDRLNPPIAEISLEIENHVSESILRNKILSVNFDYKILDFHLNTKK